MNDRRDFIRNAFLALGGFALPGALPRVSASQLAVRPGGRPPMRFIFMHKGNGLYPSFLVPPTLSPEDMQKENKKEPFVLDLEDQSLPDWMGALEA